MRELTLQEIDAGREKIFTNALKLIEESELLFSHGCYERSYTLSHLALEELFKIPMLLRAGIEVIHGLKVDWGLLEKRFRNHKSKQNGSLLMVWTVFMSQETSVGDLSKEEALGRLLSAQTSINDFKNFSMYVSWTEKGFSGPADIITKEDAQIHFALAKGSSKFYSMIEATIGPLSGKTRHDVAASSQEIGLDEFFSITAALAPEQDLADYFPGEASEGEA